MMFGIMPPQTGRRQSGSFSWCLRRDVGRGCAVRVQDFSAVLPVFEELLVVGVVWGEGKRCPVRPLEKARLARENIGRAESITVHVKAPR